MLVGIGAFVGVLLVLNVAIVAWALSSDRGFEPSDVGDAFEKAAVVARYADERLAAAATNASFPEIPHVLADQTSLRLALIVTLLSHVAILVIVRYASRQRFQTLFRVLGLDSVKWRGLWVPMLALVAAYVLTFIWVIGSEATGIEWLRPESTVPVEITRNDLTLGIAGLAVVVGAPLGEELFFRGLVFSGLLRWGFWPAASLSALAFSMVHFDPGSLVPFFGIGVVMAWLYWRSGTLWHAIAFHACFNLASFSILVVST